jgi:dihydrofolate reductase
MQKPHVSIVVAMGTGRAIGKNNALLWHIPDDLKRFKALTLGHPVIMGRKTFESIVAVLGKALPGRTNIVITRDENWTYDGAIVAHALEDALRKARDADSQEIFIGGGTEVYTQALPFVDRLFLTRVEDNTEGDAYFPEYEQEFTKVVKEESQEWNGLRYTWLDLER